jgi:hypothetical protein
MPILALLPSGARWVHRHEPGQELVVEKLLCTDEVVLSALPTCPATACKCQLASLTSMVARVLAFLSRHLIRSKNPRNPLVAVITFMLMSF